MTTDWETIYERFDPEEPVPIEHPGWRAPRLYSPADQLKPALNVPFGDKRFLIIGTVGTGKSTELHQLAEARTERDFVVIVDLWHHFAERVGDPAALDSLQPWEVVFLVGLHVMRAASEQGHVWPAIRTRAFAEARESFSSSPDEPKVDIARLAAAVSVTIGGALGGTGSAVAAGIARIAGTARWMLPIGRRTRALDQEPRVQDMLTAVNALIRDIQDRYRKRVALFVDGLDRVRNLDTVHQLFVESSMLGKIGKPDKSDPSDTVECSIVLTGPIAVRRQGLGGALVQFDARVLANVPVMEPDAKAPPLPDIGQALTQRGRAFFREAWHGRVKGLQPDTAMAIPATELDRLAWASGGRAREFVRMIRMVAARSYTADLDIATSAIIDDVIDERRRTYELGINRTHLDLLRDVLADPNHDLPDADEVLNLLDRYWLLPYPNESAWYAPNPLLMLVKLRGSATSGKP